MALLTAKYDIVSFKRKKTRDFINHITEHTICDFLSGGQLESSTWEQIKELARVNTSADGNQYVEANDTVPEVPEGNPQGN